MSRTIIVVDDSKLARMVVGGILGRVQPGWRMVEASNGADALALVREEGVDLALVDFNMPDMDGLTLVEELRAVRPDMPVAVISANAQDSIVARVRSLGAAFIEKPLKDESLQPFLSGAALKLRRAGK